MVKRFNLNPYSLWAILVCLIASICEVILGISSIGACIRYADSMDNMRYRLAIYDLAAKVENISNLNVVTEHGLFAHITTLQHTTNY